MPEPDPFHHLAIVCHAERVFPHDVAGKTLAFGANLSAGVRFPFGAEAIFTPRSAAWVLPWYWRVSGFRVFESAGRRVWGAGVGEVKIWDPAAVEAWRGFETADVVARLDEYVSRTMGGLPAGPGALGRYRWDLPPNPVEQDRPQLPFLLARLSSDAAPLPQKLNLSFSLDVAPPAGGPLAAGASLLVAPVFEVCDGPVDRPDRRVVATFEPEGSPQPWGDPLADGQDPPPGPWWWRYRAGGRDAAVAPPTFAHVNPCLADDPTADPAAGPKTCVHLSTYWVAPPPEGSRPAGDDWVTPLQNRLLPAVDLPQRMLEALDAFADDAPVDPAFADAVLAAARDTAGNGTHAGPDGLSLAAQVVDLAVPAAAPGTAARASRDAFLSALRRADVGVAAADPTQPERWRTLLRQVAPDAMAPLYDDNGEFKPPTRAGDLVGPLQRARSAISDERTLRDLVTRQWESAASLDAAARQFWADHRDALFRRLADFPLARRLSLDHFGRAWQRAVRQIAPAASRADQFAAVVSAVREEMNDYLAGRFTPGAGSYGSQWPPAPWPGLAGRRAGPAVPATAPVGGPATVPGHASVARAGRKVRGPTDLCPTRADVAEAIARALSAMAADAAPDSPANPRDDDESDAGDAAPTQAPHPLTFQVDRLGPAPTRPDDVQVGSAADFQTRVAGFGILMSEDAGRAGTWRCLNLARLALVGRPAPPVSRPTAAATTPPIAGQVVHDRPVLVTNRLGYRDDLRQVFVSYDNQPLAAISPAGGLAGGASAVPNDAAADPEGLLAYFYVPTARGPGDMPLAGDGWLRMPRLKFGQAYHVLAFVRGNCGALPKALADPAHPAALRPQSAFAPADPDVSPYVRRVRYLRRVSVGDPWFDAPAAREPVGPTTRPAADGPAFQLPALPDGVVPLARELAATAVGRELHDRSGYVGVAGRGLLDLSGGDWQVAVRGVQPAERRVGGDRQAKLVVRLFPPAGSGRPPLVELVVDYRRGTGRDAVAFTSVRVNGQDERMTADGPPPATGSETGVPRPRAYDVVLRCSLGTPLAGGGRTWVLEAAAMPDGLGRPDLVVRAGPFPAPSDVDAAAASVGVSATPSAVVGGLCLAFRMPSAEVGGSGVEDPSAALPPVLLLPPPTGGQRAVTFAVRPATTDVETWLRWVAKDEFAASDRAAQRAIVARYFEAAADVSATTVGRASGRRPSRDLVLTDPAVEYPAAGDASSRQAVFLVEAVPVRTVTQRGPQSLIARTGAGRVGSDDPYDRFATRLTVRCETAAGPKQSVLEWTGDTVVLRPAAGEVWELVLRPVVAERHFVGAGRRFFAAFAAGLAKLPLGPLGDRPAEPSLLLPTVRLLVEAAVNVQSDPATGIPSRSEVWAALAARVVGGTGPGGTRAAELRLDLRPLGDDARWRFELVGGLEVRRQVWRSSGRPIPPFPYASGHALDPVPAAAGPSPGPAPSPAMAWEAAAFADRPDFDHLSTTLPLHVGQRGDPPPSATAAGRGGQPPGALPTADGPLLFAEDLSADPRAVYYRFAARAVGRYAALDPAASQLSNASDDGGSGRAVGTPWRRLLVPAVPPADGVVVKPRVLIVLPLTECDPADGGDPATPGLLVVCNEAHDRFDVRIAAEIDAVNWVREPGRDYPQFGPDPTLSGAGHPPAVPVLLGDSDVVGPIGHTFDRSRQNPLFVNASYLVRPPRVTDPQSGRPVDLSWYFARVRFRRVIDREALAAAPDHAEPVSPGQSATPVPLEPLPSGAPTRHRVVEVLDVAPPASPTPDAAIVLRLADVRYADPKVPTNVPPTERDRWERLVAFIAAENSRLVAAARAKLVGVRLVALGDGGHGGPVGLATLGVDPKSKFNFRWTVTRLGGPSTPATDAPQAGHDAPPPGQAPHLRFLLTVSCRTANGTWRALASQCLELPAGATATLTLRAGAGWPAGGTAKWYPLYQSEPTQPYWVQFLPSRAELDGFDRAANGDAKPVVVWAGTESGHGYLATAADGPLAAWLNGLVGWGSPPAGRGPFYHAAVVTRLIWDAAGGDLKDPQNLQEAYHGVYLWDGKDRLVALGADGRPGQRQTAWRLGLRVRVLRLQVDPRAGRATAADWAGRRAPAAAADDEATFWSRVAGDPQLQDPTADPADLLVRIVAISRPVRLSVVEPPRPADPPTAGGPEGATR